MPEATPGNMVKVHYTGKLETGEVFDSSVDRDPLEFKLGEGRVIPGFEQAIVGMQPGESKTATIPSEQAYGPRRDDMVVGVQREQIPAEIDPVIGKQLQLRQSDGQTVTATVTEVSDSQVTLDANHPLAGKDLTFDLELVEVK